ncbi:hypothetical protein LTR64_006735 [Lithohypha guttulata]|uniref:uncharacterized protein n=1 Tax=Lithohypha guttulata TaxID=1690604 RepID=UPI002DDFD2F1|nr:hypothetical protein LTR51_004705 [Lithohypha guttulata]
MTTASPCGEVQDVIFYTFDNPYTAGQVDFKICERCYLGYCVSAGLESRFAKVSVPGVAKCDFHPTAPRFARYIGKYCEMVLINNPNVFIEYACKMELAPPCPGSETLEIRQWWGTDQFNFCAECYEDFGKDTVFERGFRWRGNLIKHQKCDMHSQNMRRRYWESCQKQDLMEFNEYCKAREQIYRELIQTRINAQIQAPAQPQQPCNITQSLSARLSQQHSFRMNMMNLVNAQNGRSNAAMSGLMSQGSSYNSWYDSRYQSYQIQYNAAQQGLVMSAVGGAGGGGNAQNNETAVVQSALATLAALEERWKEVE